MRGLCATCILAVLAVEVITPNESDCERDRPLVAWSWQPEAPQGIHGRPGHRQVPDGAGGQEGRGVRRHPDGPQQLADAGGRQRRELAYAYANPRLQLLGNSVEHIAYQPLLAAVHGFQPGQVRVGDAQPGVLHPVGHALQGIERLPEDPAVVGFVGVQRHGLGLPREGVLQRHPGRHRRSRREVVNRHRPGLARVTITTG